MLNWANGRQSGEGDIDFDRIFTGDQVAVGLAPKAPGEGMYVDME